MSEIIKEFKKGDLLYIDNNKKAYWGLPQGYPYKEQGKTEFAILGEVEFEKYPDNNAQTRAFVNEKLVAGEKYAVVLDGKEYVATAYERTSSSGLTLTMIGNAAQEDGTFDENGPPFYCATLNAVEEVTLFMSINAEVGVHTVEIYKFAEVIHPMATEFLPQATSTTHGTVKQMSYIPNATGDAPTAENFNQLLRQLKNAGLMK